MFHPQVNAPTNVSTVPKPSSTNITSPNTSVFTVGRNPSSVANVSNASPTPAPTVSIWTTAIPTASRTGNETTPLAARQWTSPCSTFPVFDTRVRSRRGIFVPRCRFLTRYASRRPSYVPYFFVQMNYFL